MPEFADSTRLSRSESGAAEHVSGLLGRRWTGMMITGVCARVQQRSPIPDNACSVGFQLKRRSGADPAPLEALARAQTLVGAAARRPARAFRTVERSKSGCSMMRATSWPQPALVAASSGVSPEDPGCVSATALTALLFTTRNPAAKSQEAFATRLPRVGTDRMALKRVA